MSLIERAFRERIVLVGVTIPPESTTETEAHLDELAQLIDTAGADEAARVMQRRDAPDPATYIGSGKAQELHELSEAVDADTVVFDDDLTPGQQRNLEKISVARIVARRISTSRPDASTSKARPR